MYDQNASFQEKNSYKKFLSEVFQSAGNTVSKLK